MKALTDKQIQQVKKLEDKGDMLVEQAQFESCLSAVDYYLKAQSTLFSLANERDPKEQQSCQDFKSSNVSYNAWYINLGNKISKANSMLADPKIARK